MTLNNVRVETEGLVWREKLSDKSINLIPCETANTFFNAEAKKWAK